MTAETAAANVPAPRTPEEGTGVFLYAVVPGDVEPTPDALGLGDPPGRVTVVTHRDIAALVSDVELARPLGRPDDVITYQRLLDGTAAVAPVLPVRFGTVLTGPDAVADLLADYYDEFLAALTDLEGRFEYVVRGRYDERRLLTEVLHENPEAAGLRDQLRGQPHEAAADLRIRLGEVVSRTVEAKRVADTQRVVDALAPLSVGTIVRPPTHEEDAANVALLVESARQPEFDEALEALTREWAGRATLRRLGPLAPYDFVAPLQPGA
jgi:hypothetical protein